MPPELLNHPMTSHLRILQYNVHTTQGKVIAPLLADHSASEFIVLAVEEPWRNPCVLTTHKPASSSFYLLYPLTADVSVCFFVNKSFNPRSYSASFPTPMYGYLRISSPVEGDRDVIIHNGYRTRNISPTSSENLPPDNCQETT